jgi:hypothetical protein
LTLGCAGHRSSRGKDAFSERIGIRVLEEARRRVRTEHKIAGRQNADKEQTLEVRSHVLTLRSGHFVTHQ